MSKTSLGRVSLVPKGAYNAVTAYERLDVVTYEGASYIVLRDVQGVTPVDGEDYMLLAEGLPGPKGDPGDTPELSIGTVTTLEPGSEAKASFTGTKEKPVLNLELPRGASGGVDVASAEVGQTIVVKAVDENGKPTEWEAADMASGGGWRKIAGSEFDGSETAELVVTTDENGETFSLKKMLLILHTPNATSNTLFVRLYNAGSETGDLVFYSSSFPAVKTAPVVSYVDFTTPFPTGWAAQTSGWFHQNALGFLGGSRDPRVESSAIAKIEIRNASGGPSYLGANCFYEIWGVDA